MSAQGTRIPSSYLISLVSIQYFINLFIFFYFKCNTILIRFWSSHLTQRASKFCSLLENTWFYCRMLVDYSIDKTTHSFSDSPASVPLVSVLSIPECRSPLGSSAHRRGSAHRGAVLAAWPVPDLWLRRQRLLRSHKSPRRADLHGLRVQRERHDARQ